MQTKNSIRDSLLINNDYYHDLGEKWYNASDDPIALLRAESRLRNAWITETIRSQIPTTENILDVGCGAGFLSNYLATAGYKVTGIDLSDTSLEVARSHDHSGHANYLKADAYDLPFPKHSFDVVTSTDFLEHVSEPKKVISEISRVLKPGGIFFFHTFNKNPLANLVVIKGVEWFVKNSPKDLHVYDMFIPLDELIAWLIQEDFEKPIVRGCRPKINGAFFKMLVSREVPANFQFKWTKSTLISYTGWARKHVSDV